VTAARPTFVLAAALLATACTAEAARVVDGGPLDAEGWPVRPADRKLRCPDGTDLIDDIAPTGRRTVTCKSKGNPLPRGFQLTWSEDGTLVSRFELSDEGAPRARTRWFDDGTRAAEATYEEGRLVHRRTWYSNGEKKSETDWNADAGVLSVKRFQPDGSVEAEGQTRDGMKVGTWREWRDAAMETLEYVDGVPHGEVVRRYPAGGVERGRYEAGERQGKWIRTDRNGNPVREVMWSHGKRTGVYRLYHPNTQLREEGHYLDGKKHGDWKTWYPSGELESEAWYSCGTPVGPFRLYFPDGAPKKAGTYEDGRSVGEWQTFNDAGVATRIEQFNAPSAEFDPGALPNSCRDTE
jgi:antitoxin component YwqK of YwqJK toxin-antitoxin module